MKQHFMCPSCSLTPLLTARAVNIEYLPFCTCVLYGVCEYRTGTLEPGDRLLGIDNVKLEHCGIDEAMAVLQQAEDMVRLRIQKDEDNLGACLIHKGLKKIIIKHMVGFVFSTTGVNDKSTYNISFIDIIS